MSSSRSGMERLAYMKKKLLSPSPTPAGRTSRPAARNLTEMIGGGSMGRRSAATPTPHILRARENDEGETRVCSPGEALSSTIDTGTRARAVRSHLPGLLGLLPDDEVILAVPSER
jgi:hypothetical protein